MEWRFIEDEITYDGTQLRSGWVAEKTSLAGDALACFVGPANVPIENMVDMDDVAANAPIFSAMMLHFIIEHPKCALDLAVARQRILVAIAQDELARLAGNVRIERRGDDIFEGNYKISVSIATSSPSSSLIHFALNVISDGAPVPAKGLLDYDVEARPFGEIVAKRYCDELASMSHAEKKVRPVE